MLGKIEQPNSNGPQSESEIPALVFIIYPFDYVSLTPNSAIKPDKSVSSLAQPVPASAVGRS
jgi:hypothetical protein